MKRNSTNTDADDWSLDISADSRFGMSSITELYQYRYLLFKFVYRDFVTIYKQTVLGPAWILLKPLLTTVAFAAAFTGILGLSTEGIPPILFYLSGILCWGLFADVFSMTSTVFVDNASIFNKVYFPRLIRPLSIALSSFMRMSIQLIMLAAFISYYHNAGDIQWPGISVLLVVPILLAIVILGLGMGLIFSSVTSKYRDLRHLVQFGIQLLMYVTPVIYPISQVPDSLRTWMFVNPLAPLIEAFRSLMLGLQLPSAIAILYSIVVGLVIFWLGLIAFNKVEARAMDTI